MSKPCTHDNCVFLHQTHAANVIWCPMCGASAINASPAGHNWRLPEREKWNLTETPERDDEIGKLKRHNTNNMVEIQRLRDMARCVLAALKEHFDD